MSPPAFSPARRLRGTRAVALVLVLSFLALITVLIIAFFTSVTTELGSVKSYASETSTRRLADSAVQLVMGSIQQAASGDTTVAWASQPGMVRTWDSSGRKLAAYKLYSSDNMVVTGTDLQSFDPGADVPPADWRSKPALYTDLNAPVYVATDPANPQTLTLNYPVIDPAAEGDVEGFSINLRPGYSGSNPAPDNNPAPMPTRWLYVLRDGTLTAPTGVDAGGRGASFAGARNVPSRSNPIMGRVAFWTDDDSSKVNINTASEGVFVDIPRTASIGDVNFANNQPGQREFQRYPGHPAMTCLSPVLGKWLVEPSSTVSGNAYSFLFNPAAAISASNPNPAAYLTYLKPYYDLAPRVVDGISGSNTGSQGGTAPPTGTRLAPDADRLYASVDELMFKPISVSGTRQANGAAANTFLTKRQVEETRFFLTADSRSPDTNLFNQPRVCVWPLSSGTDDKHRTALDKLIAFCSTTNSNGTQPYVHYFQRGDGNYLSQTADISLNRNQELIAYLRRLCGTNVPGFGGNLASKYATANTKGGTDMDQILTEIFDYIRITNIHDVANNTAGYVPYAPDNLVVPSYDANTDTQGFGRFLTISQAALLFIGAEDGDWDQDQIDPAISDPNKQLVNPTTALQRGQEKIQTALLLNLYNTAPGYPMLSFPNVAARNKLTVRVSNLSSLTGDAGALFGSETMLLSQLGDCYGLGWSGTGGDWGPAQLFAGAANTTGTPANTLPASNTAAFQYRTVYPPGAVRSAVYPKGTTMGLNGGTALVEILYNGMVMQTINLRFPGATLPMPTLVNSTYSKNNPAAWANPDPADLYKTTDDKTNDRNHRPWMVPVFWNSSRKVDFSSLLSRFSYNANVSGVNGGAAYNGILLSTITPWDVVRSVNNASGDVRLSAAKHAIAANDPVFQPHAKYNDANAYMAHSLVLGNGTTSTGGLPFYGATRGSLVHFAANDPKSSQYFAQASPWPTSTYPGSPPSGPTNITANSFPPFKAPPSDTGFPCNSQTFVNLWPENSSNQGGFSSSNIQKPIATSEPVGVNSGRTGSGNGVAAGSNNPFGVDSTVPGDWDNAVGNLSDGAFINKVDEGAMSHYAGQSPYYDFAGASDQGSVPISIFSPNRQMPSAVMFGSLPTGVIANRPWQTLLFHPDPGGSPQHIGAQSPGDHLLLDLFTMPMVEPYAISEPLSTAGRVNMNYQIVPFTYINRDTALRAVMKSERIMAIPNSNAGGNYPYKNNYAVDSRGTANGLAYGNSPAYLKDLRHDINFDETRKAFEKRFSADKDLFRAPSEICTLDLVPYVSTDPNSPDITAPAWSANGSTMQQYWAEHALTGDNTRERPYADIYPRLTTRSNTFTVHLRVQALKKSSQTDPTVWSGTGDSVLAEYRGSQIIERYIDPNDPNIPDYVKPTATVKSLDAFYKFRVLGVKQFTP